jgi:hypothetical protein
VAKKLRWKNPEPGLFVAGHFRVVKLATGKWELWHKNTKLANDDRLRPDFDTKKEAQTKALELSSLYVETPRSAEMKRPPFMMFDVKGEVAKLEGHKTGIVRACGASHQFLAIRVVQEKGVQVPDVSPSSPVLGLLGGKLLEIRKGIGLAFDDQRPLTTTQFIGEAGEWVVVLLPFVVA